MTPEELPFRKLIKVMRSSCRTYDLFDIAKIILEKPERYILNIEPLDANFEEHKNGNSQLLGDYGMPIPFVTPYK